LALGSAAGQGGRCRADRGGLRESLHVSTSCPTATFRRLRERYHSATSIRSGSTGPIPTRSASTKLDPSRVRLGRERRHPRPCTNQHHQKKKNKKERLRVMSQIPSLMGAALSKLTNGPHVAIIHLGSTLPSTSPPTRIAEDTVDDSAAASSVRRLPPPACLPHATISNAKK